MPFKLSLNNSKCEGISQFHQIWNYFTPKLYILSILIVVIANLEILLDKLMLTNL